MLQLQFYYRVPTNQKTFNIREDSGGGNGRDNKALDQRPHNKFFFPLSILQQLFFSDFFWLKAEKKRSRSKQSETLETY